MARGWSSDTRLAWWGSLGLDVVLASHCGQGRPTRGKGEFVGTRVYEDDTVARHLRELEKEPIKGLFGIALFHNF